MLNIKSRISVVHLMNLLHVHVFSTVIIFFLCYRIAWQGNVPCEVLKNCYSFHFKEKFQVIYVQCIHVAEILKQTEQFNK